MTKTKIKETFKRLLVKACILAVALQLLFSLSQLIVRVETNIIYNYFYKHEGISEVTVKRKEKTVKQYAYNAKVPVEVVKAEIRKQAKEFGLGENFMLQLAFDESGYNNLATNSKSTATGVYQYLWGTWKETESWKNHHIARTDYKANIREAMIDISNGEHFRWDESLK